jgi:carboxyl-terminal processing protease
MFFVNKYVGVAAAALLIFVSCKKEINEVTTEPAATTTDAIKDTALSYSRDIYLWYNQVPGSFNARSYADPDKMMTALRQYSLEPGFTGPADRWSFAMKQKEWDDVSSGIAGDFGLGVFFRNTSDLRVKLVEATSPAGLAGVRRGWRITKINGNSDMTTANSDFVVRQVFNSNKATFTFEKPDGTAADVTLNTARYQENPIVLDSVYKVGSKNIGYLAFNSFLGDTTQIYNAFSRIFSRFVAQQVNDVIVDLRYNGGGYVSVQEKLANYLAPLTANGNLMMTQQFNDKNTQYNTTHYFKKQGTFVPSRLFFIVSKSTASASELLINNLKPWVNVQLVGPGKTYGKPVGFFPVPVADWYIFPVSFRTTNINGEGAYFDGLALNKQVADGLDKDWGDVRESCLASILNFIETGGFLGQPGPSGYTQKADVVRGNDVLSKPGFKGMIDVRGMP